MGNEIIEKDTVHGINSNGKGNELMATDIQYRFVAKHDQNHTGTAGRGTSAERSFVKCPARLSIL